MLLRRDDWQAIIQRACPLCVAERQELSSKAPKGKASVRPEDRWAASSPNEVWAMDFKSDQHVDGWPNSCFDDPQRLQSAVADL